MRSIRFFLCTRDRPDIARQCIAGIKHSISNSTLTKLAVCYVFDDSLSIDNSISLRQACSLETSETLYLEFVDSAYQADFIEKLTRTAPVSSSFIYSICKILGTGPWDLAGVRNFAFMYAYVVSDPNDLLIFVDDDMSFTDVTYQGYFMPVNGAEVLSQLYKTIVEGNALAAGVGYRGRRDMSIIEHLTNICEVAVAKLNNAELFEAQSYIEHLGMFPTSLPIQLSLPGDNLDIGLGPAGISGAVLAVKPASLLSHYLMRRYNEDWIWLLLLGHSDTEIKRVKETVVHAAPAQNSTTLDFMVYQETGEIIFNVVNNIVCHVPTGHDRLEWCKNQLSIEHILKAKEKQIQDIDICLHGLKRIADSFYTSLTENNSIYTSIYNALNLVKQLKQTISNLSHQQMLDEILIYLNEKNAWQEVLVHARANLRNGESNAQSVFPKGSQND